MKEGKISNRKQTMVMAAGGTVVVLLILSLLVFMVYVDRKETNRTILEISDIYMAEMADQMAGHFDTTMAGQFTRVSSVMTNITPGDLESQETLSHFIEEKRQKNNFVFLAMLDDKGNFYSADGCFPAEGLIGSARALLDGEENCIESNKELLGRQIILITARMKPVQFGENNMIAAVVGMEPSFLSQRLSLYREGANAYGNIIDKEGNYILVYEGNKEDSGENVFDFLESNAVFDNGYTSNLLSREISEGKTGVTAYTLDGVHKYLYYIPLSLNGWYMCVSMPYGKLDERISGLSDVMARMAIIVILMITAVLLSMFTGYAVVIRQKNRLLTREKASTEQALSLAEEASLAKSEFLSRMSHEIRTPLNGIIGMNHIAMHSLDNPEKVQDCLRKVEISSEQLLVLLNDVLDMTKVESGKIELCVEKMDFSLMLDQLTAIAGSQAAEKNIDFRMEISLDRDLSLMGDSLRVSQIINNLLSNAFKFTPPGGRVELRVRETEVRENMHWMQFSVKDSGCGIRKENLEKIFRPFEQEGSKTAKTYGGTGLGLAISRRLAELMGGRITVESRPGEGSLFMVEIPFREAEASEAVLQGAQHNTAGMEKIPEEKLSERNTREQDNGGRNKDGTARAEGRTFKGKRILIVEDNELNQEIASEFIRMTGAEAEIAGNGKEAVSKFAASEEGYYDLILMDILMPEMGGYEASGIIRSMKRKDAGTVPIFAMTANAFAEDVEMSRKAGMNAHISKPVSAASLYEEMDKVFDKYQRQGNL